MPTLEEARAEEGIKMPLLPEELDEIEERLQELAFTHAVGNTLYFGTPGWAAFLGREEEQKKIENFLLHLKRDLEGTLREMRVLSAEAEQLRVDAKLLAEAVMAWDGLEHHESRMPLPPWPEGYEEELRRLRCENRATHQAALPVAKRHAEENPDANT